ncbi:MAG: hypothetical protein OK439_01670 [Thaumarchaeota archaeon]|nr:hypothetical protein [Nitrososphaerota archaeon]
MDHAHTCEEITKNQRSVFLHLDVWHLPEMIDIKPEAGGAYIHSSSGAFNEEGEEKAYWENLSDYLKLED